MSQRLRFLSVACIVPIILGSSHVALAQWGAGYGYPMYGSRYGYNYPSLYWRLSPSYTRGYGYGGYGYGGYGYPGYYGYGGYGRRGYYGLYNGFYDSGISSFGGGIYPGASFGFNPAYLASRAFTAGGVAGGLTFGWPQTPEPEVPRSSALVRAATSPAPVPIPPAPASATPPTAAATSGAAESIVVTGETAFRNGDYPAAIEEWKNALGDGPRNPVLVLMLGEACFAAGDYRQAATAIQEALHELPQDRWGIVISNRRELYGRPSTYILQLRQLEDAVNDNPRNTAQRFVLAYHYAFLGYPQAAVEQLEKVADLDPDDRPAAQFREALQSRLPDTGAPVITPGGVTPRTAAK